MFAEAKTSAGAPRRICAASVSEPAKEYFGDGSIRGNTLINDAAARTVTWACVRVGSAGAVVTPIDAPITATVAARTRAFRAVICLMVFISPP